MKIGISSWAFSWSIGVDGFPLPAHPWHAADIVNYAIKAGVQVIQLADNLSYSEDEIILAAQVAHAYGLDFEIGIAGTHPDKISAAVDMAQKCNAKLIRTLPHCQGDIPSVDEIITRINNTLSLLVENEIVLAIENHDYYKASDLAYIMDKVGHPNVGICLDSVNNYGTGESFREVTQTLLPYIKSFHYKDFVIRRIPYQTGFSITGAPAGQGLIDLNYMLSQLPKDVNWIIEQWVPWQGNINSTVMLEQKWARAGCNYLQHVLSMA